MTEEVDIIRNIRFEREGAIGTIVLADPPNWLNIEFAESLRVAVHQASESDIRVLHIRAEGPDFSVGGAVREWPGKSADWFRTFVAEVNASYRALELLRIPIVCSVQGEVLGGGFELALSADFLVAAESARFQCVEITTGMVPLAGAVQRLADMIGPARTARMAMLGERLTATEAAELNVVSWVVPDDELAKTGTELAERLARGPTKGYAAIRALLKAWSAGGTPGADHLMYDLTMDLYRSEDTTNAIPAIARAMDRGEMAADIPFRGR
ncbi:enoyl-CoA hydratase/carnithine racemase [Pseudonocardia eucalypti]|uniref:enoyl-CoA hydratase-related protein n=1 Tax=Pseudonocardia eucalypti TaxID=648755 RepID=UPI001618AF32|nr:enoyl-CoA hydratase/carnithine racemase [Pseudonocardia eucalypti]